MDDSILIIAGLIIAMTLAELRPVKWVYYYLVDPDNIEERIRREENEHDED
jgi:hypothetical protein